MSFSSFFQEGQTPLHIAVRTSHIEYRMAEIKLLLTRGADPNAQDQVSVKHVLKGDDVV